MERAKEKPRYVNPKTDIGFKTIFGQKEFMISFLEALFKKDIEDIEYLQQEQIPDSPELKTCVYDIFCKAKNGDRFIVEMQVASNINFKDRMLYYICRAIVNQILRGGSWRLCPVYGIFFTDFTIEEGSNNNFIRKVSLMFEDNHKKFHDKINMIFIEMPNFAKSETECESMLDKWVLNVTNMAENKHIAFAENEEIFRRLTESALMDKLSPDGQLAHQMYLDNLMQFKWGLEDAKILAEQAIKEATEKAAKEAAKKATEEGIKKGMEKGARDKAIETARKMKALGMDDDVIIEVTGLSLEDLKKL